MLLQTQKPSTRVLVVHIGSEKGEKSVTFNAINYIDLMCVYMSVTGTTLEENTF